MAKAKGTSQTSAPTKDSFKNFVARVGRGTGNQNDASHYGFNPVTRNRMQMDWVYRGSWIAGRVVDCVARDMTREGVRINTDDDPAKMAEFTKDVERLNVWPQLCSTVKWARLYGGALAFMMIDGQDPSTPLKLETIQKGQFKGLLPLDRWVAMPSLTGLVEEYGPHFGKPMFYDTVPDTGGMPRLKIHYSRVIRIPGVELPYWQAITENLWDQSVLERMWDRLIAFDSTTAGAAQLVYKAHLRTLKIKGLRQLIGGNAVATAALAANVEMIRYMQSNEGLTLLDGDDDFQTHQYTFTGLDNVLMQFSEQLAGATDIPLVRLFGQSPKGFSTGETDLRNYYDSIKQQQVQQLGQGIDTLYRLMYINKFGKEPPKVFEIEFAPLWVMTDIEKAEIVNKVTTALVSTFEAGIVKRSTVLLELKGMSKETNIYSNISDEEIKEAEADPAPTPEALGLEIPEKIVAPPGEPGAPSGKPGASKAPTKDRIWHRLGRAWRAAWADADGPAKAHLKIGGLDIAVETPVGQQRRPEWPVMTSHYGYINGHEGADGDSVDCFVRDGTPEGYTGGVYVINQPKQDGTFDEHKVMIGWETQSDAEQSYLSNYQVGWKLGPVDSMTMGEFKDWLDQGSEGRAVGRSTG